MAALNTGCLQLPKVAVPLHPHGAVVRSPLEQRVACVRRRIAERRAAVHATAAPGDRKSSKRNAVAHVGDAGKAAPLAVEGARHPAVLSCRARARRQRRAVPERV